MLPLCNIGEFLRVRRPVGHHLRTKGAGERPLSDSGGGQASSPFRSPAKTPRVSVEVRSNRLKERALSALRSSKSGKSADSKPASTRTKTTSIDPAILAKLVAAQLEEDKAENILEIPLAGKSPMADTMIVASGRSARHVAALADHVFRKLKESGASKVRMEGMPNADWVLIDAGDVIVHIFRPEVREFYNIEKMWAVDFAADAR
jgi:ribosome-associated protein